MIRAIINLISVYLDAELGLGSLGQKFLLRDCSHFLVFLIHILSNMFNFCALRMINSN